MTAVATQFSVRVMVTTVWDQVSLVVDTGTRVADLKRQALAGATGRVLAAGDFVVKFGGALVLDESMTLGALGAVPNAAFIILPSRRLPVR
jgi:hypothetical protein